MEPDPEWTTLQVSGTVRVRTGDWIGASREEIASGVRDTIIEDACVMGIDATGLVVHPNKE